MSVQIAELPVSLDVRPKHITIGAVRNADMMVALQLISSNWGHDVSLDFFEEARQALSPEFFQKLVMLRDRQKHAITAALSIIVWSDALAWPVESLYEPILTAGPDLAAKAEGLGPEAAADRSTFIRSLLARYDGEKTVEEGEKWLGPMYDFLVSPRAARVEVVELMQEFWANYFSDVYIREMPGLQDEQTRAMQQLGEAPRVADILDVLPPRHFVRANPQGLVKYVERGFKVHLMPMRFAGGLGAFFLSSDTVYIGYTLPTVRVENVFDQVAKSVATRFKALADPTRLRILKFLCCQEMYTWQIAEFVGVAQPTATEHLRILREAGFVTSRKQGSFVFYRTDSDAIKRACVRLTEIIG